MDGLVDQGAAGLWEENSKKNMNVFEDVSRMFDTILYY